MERADAPTLAASSSRWGLLLPDTASAIENCKVIEPVGDTHHRTGRT